MSIRFPKIFNGSNYQMKKASFSFSNKNEMINKMIKNRMNEVKSMTIRKDLYEMNVDNFSDELRKFISSLTTIPSFEYKQKMRREKQKEKKYFRYIARVILLFTKSMLTRRKYFLEKWLEGLNTDPTLLHEEQEKFRAVSIKQCHEFKSALSKDSIKALETSCDNRNEEKIKAIMNLLSRYNGFDSVIPLDKARELAERVKYHKLENGRVVSLEGAKPNRIYYVISGKISMVRKFELTDGDLWKVVGHLNKGDVTDPVDIEKNVIRHYSLYSKGVSEVLMLDTNDLKVLCYFNYHLPVDFLKELDLFKSYPFNLLLKRYEAVTYKYYGPDKVIAKDPENTQFIYVIKSGTAKIVKKIRLHGKQESRDVARSQQVRQQPVINSTEIPATNRSRSELKSETYREQYSSSELVRRKPAFPRSETYLPPLHREKTMGLSSPQKQRNAYFMPKLRKEISLDSAPFALAQTLVSTRTEPDDARYVAGNKEKSFFLTRASTQLLNAADSADEDGVAESAAIESGSSRPNFIVIDTVGKGEILGLNALKEKSKGQQSHDLIEPHMAFHRKSRRNSDEENLILLSEGCELILLNKQSFMACADVDTICKIEQLEDSANKYMSEDKVREYFKNKEQWSSFKKGLFDSLVESRRKNVRHN